MSIPERPKATTVRPFAPTSTGNRVCAKFRGCGVVRWSHPRRARDAEGCSSSGADVVAEPPPLQLRGRGASGRQRRRKHRRRWGGRRRYSAEIRDGSPRRRRWLRSVGRAAQPAHGTHASRLSNRCAAPLAPPLASLPASERGAVPPRGADSQGKVERLKTLLDEFNQVSLRAFVGATC